MPEQTSLRILLVDDNVDHVHSLAQLLTTHGHHVSYATNGVTALELAQRGKPEVIVLDIDLPDTSGLELARQFRRDPELKTVRLIAMTGSSVSMNEALAAGFDELLT